MKEFVEIYDEYVKQVYQFLIRLCGDESLAEELTQQTFFKAFLNINRFKGKCKISTWLCSIAKNEWLSNHRKNKRLVQMEEMDELMDQCMVEEDFIKKELQRRIREEILLLNDQYQKVMILRLYSELSFREIGLLYGKTENWAKVTYFRARKKIKERMEESL